MDEQYTVYVKTDAAGCITAINSSAFVDGTGWTAIDKGAGDRFHHAQGNYFPLPLFGPDGCANYKLANGTPALRTEAEKAAEIAARPAPEPTQLDRVEAQIAYTAMITDTMLEV
ncbi:hypothetical protein [Ruthenibacterium lactatiformans]|uniref:hypothetical protein n=1 Tax=Ruthenibacterium lactatiformans TaxID=1550024 RepID=UPI0006793049|nr:hypothetical protein [Ruthenibacterium lactatiformans]